MTSFQAQLQTLKEADLLRSAPSYARRGMMVTNEEGRELIDFSSNDYLGLSQHPELKLAAIEAVNTYGVGSTASRLISGTSPAHESFECLLAEKKKSEAALLFSTGYMTSMGVIPSVVGKEDVIIMDKLAHACLIDASRASGARLRVFPHNNLGKLESLLRSERARLRAEQHILVIVESVYSMDGDLCPLSEIIRLKEEYGALLLVDEAHGLGVLGDYGMGLVDACNLESQVDLQLGTLGKAAGGAGGYIACSRVMRDLILNKGRSFIFTTAPPPAQAAVAQKALELIDSEEGRARRLSLAQHRATLGRALHQEILPSAICPVIIGENAETLELSASLREQGFLVPAIRYPTVAKGTARLRITLSSAHTNEQVLGLIKAFNS